MELTPYILLIAVLPALLILGAVFLLDRRRPEPPALLVISFVAGMAAVPFALTVIKFLRQLTGWTDTGLSEVFLKAFVLIGLTEELSKFWITRVIAQRSDAFDEPFDGIVYSVTVAMGFAAFENVLYIMSGTPLLALSRAFTAVPAHACFAVVMGFYMGVGKTGGNLWRRNLMGLGMATFLHGSYDFFLFTGSETGMYVGGVLSLSWAVYLAWQAVAKLRPQP